MMNNAQLLQSMLFLKSDGYSKKELKKLLDWKGEIFEVALHDLKESLKTTPFSIVEHEDACMMVLNEEASFAIDSFQKKEDTKELSRASLETLAIIVHSNGVTKSGIDYARGVNSTLMLRQLLIRGLIEKKEDSKKGETVFLPTLELLRFMGIENTQSLPDFGILERLLQYEKKETEQEEI